MTDDRIQELARTLRNPNRRQVEGLLRKAVDEALSAKPESATNEGEPPRTDAVLKKYGACSKTHQFQRLVALARQLERELAAMTADRDMWLKDDAKQNAALGQVIAERDALKLLINSPETEDFDKGVPLECAHQVERWGDAHDRSKSAENWYWLVGYLAGKALRASILGDREKALHHTISAAAALRNWHKAIKLDTTGAGVGADVDLDKDAKTTGEFKR